MSTDQTPALARATHTLSEWLNDSAPIGEQRYANPARAAVSAALHDPDGDVIARTLDEHRASPATSPYCRCGWRPGMSLNDTEADRRQHRAHQADAVRAAILGADQ